MTTSDIILEVSHASAADVDFCLASSNVRGGAWFNLRNGERGKLARLHGVLLFFKVGGDLLYADVASHFHAIFLDGLPSLYFSSWFDYFFFVVVNAAHD